MGDLRQDLGYFDLSRLKVCLDQMLKITPSTFGLRPTDLESSNSIEMYKIMLFKALLCLFRKEYLAGVPEENSGKAEQLVMLDAMKCLGNSLCGLGAKEGAKSLLYLHPQVILKPDTIALSVAGS